jgi:hypothetical protein
MAAAMASNASSATGPLGLAVAKTGVTTSAPRTSAKARKAPMAVREPVPACRASSSQRGLNDASGVGTGENVLVS